MSIAHARNSDPITSHDAAESVKDLTQLQSRIMVIFQMCWGLTDEELIASYNRTYGLHSPATDSSIRSRRSELHHVGQIRDTAITRKTRAGGNSIVWDVYGRLL